MEPLLEPNARARAAVAAFLRGSSSESEAAVVSDDDEFVQRPNRLGLGATSRGTTSVDGDHARKRLERSLQAQRERNAAAVDSASSDSEPDESRTRIVGRKRSLNVGSARSQRVVHKRAPKSDAKPPQPKPQVPVVEKRVVDIPNTVVQHPLPVQEGNGGANSETVPTFGAANETRRGDVPGVRRKRTKTRSRQKNLRRDKRPPHLRPAHLTEETLKAGRMAPNNGAWAGGF